MPFILFAVVFSVVSILAVGDRKLILDLPRLYIQLLAKMVD